MKKRFLFLGLAILILSLMACQKTPDTPLDQPGEDQIIDPNPEGEAVDVTLYYINEEYIISGDESLGIAIPVETQVIVGKKPLEEAVLEALQKEPEDEKLETFLQSIKILSVETAENTAYVNISGENLSGGSLQETGILTQIILTLTELPGIEQVQFYVDGGVRETLMSHYFIQEPLTRESIGF